MNPGSDAEVDLSGVTDFGKEPRDEPLKNDVLLMGFTFKVDGLEEPKSLFNSSCVSASKCTRLSPSLRRRLTGRSGKSRDHTLF